jgi:leader peptidase (prepilin peptidase) / N-methyltransferase
MYSLLDYKTEIFKYIYLFFLGSSLGSFYKTIYDRILYFFYSPIRKELSIKQKYYNLFFTPSFCYNCKTKISYLYLIPIVGYFFTKKRCKHCGIPLSIDFLLWELFGGFLLCYLFYFYGLLAFLYVLMIFHFIIAGLIDLKKFFLDYENILFLYIFGLILFFIEWELSNIYYFLLKIFIFLFIFLVLYLLGRGKKFGFGDIILIGAISIIFEITEILIIINLGAIGSIIYILLYKKNKHSYAPLGFFLSFACIIVIIFRPFFFGILTSNSSY